MIVRAYKNRIATVVKPMPLSRLGISVLFAFAVTFSFGQANVFHSAQSLQHDFLIFRRALEQAHPGIYWYRPKSEIDSCFNSAFSAINRDMTELQFYRLLAPVIAKIGCGHTWIATTEPTQQQIWETTGVLPLKLRFIEGKAYCLQNNSTDSLSIIPGDEILSVNGIRIDSLLKLSDVFSPGDARIQTGKTKLLDEVFNQFYTLYISNPEKYVIRFNRAGQEAETTFAATPLERVQFNSKRRYPRVVPQPENINLKFLENSTAVLRVREFSDWHQHKTRVDFPAYLDRCIAKIDSARSKNLIIDLRGNDGGNEKYGLLLCSYLTDQPFVGYKQIDFRTTRFNFRKYSTTTWLQLAFLKTILVHKKVNDTTFLLTNDRATKEHTPYRTTFQGKTFVLINRGTFSTASDFAALVHDRKLATFVGEETAGSYSGNSSNYTFLITLPNTKILVNLPVARYQTNVKQREESGRGIMPDHRVKYLIDDILSGRDKDMDEVLNLIRKGI